MKVKAHAERRTPRMQWTRDEEGNVAADETAAGKMDETGSLPNELNIEPALATCMPLAWKTAAGMILLEARISARGARYMQKRDLLRSQAQPARPPRWQGTTNRLAASLWAGQECSWAMAVRVMWDKHVTGDNESKWGCRVTARCDACNALTSQRHTISECQRPGAAQIRTRAIRMAWGEADKLGSSLAGRTARTLLDLLGHEEGYTLWTGMWAPAIREEIAHRCPWQLRAKEYRQVIKVCRHLATGALQLYRMGGPAPQRKKRSREEVRVPRQTRLEDYMRRPTQEAATGHGQGVPVTDGRKFDDRNYDG